MNPWLLSFLIFVFTVLGTLTLYQALFGNQQSIDYRLSPTSGGARPQIATTSADWLVKWHVRRLRATQVKDAPEKKLPEKLTHAGYRGVEWVARFQLGRVIAMVGATAVGAVVCKVAGRPWLLGAIGGVTLGYVVPTVVVSRMARARQRKMLRELPDVLALIVVSLEAGLSVGEVLRLVGRETLRQGQVLGRELTATSAQMSAGMTFEDTMKDFGARTGLDEIRSLAALLIQSEKIGARLAPALRAAADLLNSRRRLKAEEAARKSSIKMLFPLVFFILPAMLLVILGPAVIQLMEMFAKR